MNTIAKAALILILITTSLQFAQTDSLNIFWDKNPEPDMYLYQLQRSVNSTSNFQFYMELFHPDTHAVDYDVEPGKLYAYRVAAMDSVGNLSNFSNPESVGIPRIQWNISHLVTGQDTFLTKSSFLSDPDDPASSLQLTVSEENHVAVTIQSTGIQLSPSPSDYTGTASFVLRAVDPEGFQDRRLIEFNFYDPGVNQPPEILLESLHVGAHSNNRFDLKLYAFDIDNSVEELNWEFWGYTKFSIIWYDLSDKIIEIEVLDSTVISETGYFRVYDPQYASDTAAVTIFYSAENTPPHLVNLPATLYIAEDSLATLSMIDIFVDSSNSISEATWEFEAGPNINYAFDQTIYRLSIVPSANWVGESFLIIKVSDPMGLSDQATITIIVTESGNGHSAGGKIHIYPNPVVYENGDNKVVFENLPSESKRISVFNILGQKVFEATIESNPFQLNAFDGHPLNLGSGIYIYFIETADSRNNRTGKFVILR